MPAFAAFSEIRKQERRDQCGCVHLFLIWPSYGALWGSGSGRDHRQSIGRDNLRSFCQWPYDEPENAPLCGFYSNDLDLRSQQSWWGLRGRGILLPAPDGEGLVSKGTLIVLADFNATAITDTSVARRLVRTAGPSAAMSLLVATTNLS